MKPGTTSAASVDQVLALIRSLGRPLAAERVGLAHARGRVLREAVCALEDQPPFDRSAVDGYAIRLDDAAQSFRLVDRIRVGEWKPRELQPGETVRIATGAALPGEGLQVVMQEDTRVEEQRVTVRARDRERNIRQRGEDARAGQPLMEPGARLGPGALALLASVGCAQPCVTRLPRVLHVATGNEIVPPEQTPAPGQIRDSNSTLVRAFLGQWGVEPKQLRVGEDEAAAKSEIRNPKSEIRSADLLLISGGASVGEHDFTRALLEELGYTIHVSRTTARPGKPLLFGSRGPALAFGLPGNPLAHFVCLNLYVREALARLEGLAKPPGFVEGVLAVEFGPAANARETFWPARVELAGGEARLTPLRWCNSGDLTALATANALLRVPPDCGPSSRGARMAFLPTISSE